MDNRIERLLETFQVNGWTLNGQADVVSDWWFTEILHLTSRWRPVNTNLYLILMTDPQEIKEKLVWCIRVSSIIPKDKDFSYIDQVTLNDIKKIDLGEFVQSINRIVLI